MKDQQKIKRWSRSVLQQGPSLTMSIPHDVVKEWQIAPGQQLVAYQLQDALLVIPLDSLLRHGEPKVLKALEKALA